ncbi:hypothetical protein ACUY3K_07540 [Corynebacterium uberis]|uniref:hypothetical protein n=1 Tax=Corynebacterium TaxID=1716 RepID=UPI001D0B826F|nr:MULTISPECIES: hypothetical protein [Corynebacterium]MCZ9309204.1 hypothetical protein [Corynebacterium sp. c6VSa_13]UDL72763.1 hypothetical protein LH391_06465 [Corynebacterium uberis]UDL76360.1 hypothetical protein LH393_02935 [Corynebacterium uberis]UDL78572.1 hypothetical protein LH394_02920 [Corynebacterium uberis]UDL80853.1 hypothetical protein LH392_03350 [Corynebacterium uberis]
MSVVALSRYSWPLLRDGSHVQFGLDATTAGVLHVDHAAQVVAALCPLADAPEELCTLSSRLVAAGMDAHDAAIVLSDLLAYGIIHPVPETPTVIIVGRSPLADALAALTDSLSFTVRRPLAQEDLRSYLSYSAPGTPVVLADQLAYTRTIAPAIVAGADIIIPAAIMDARGVVGPLRMWGSGPCPMCRDLHRSQADPGWHRVAPDYGPAAQRADPVLVAATAARAAAWLSILSGLPAPPGWPHSTPLPGDVITVDPYGTTTASQCHTHRLCPLCRAAHGAPRVPAELPKSLQGLK